MNVRKRDLQTFKLAKGQNMTEIRSWKGNKMAFISFPH